MSAVRLLPQSLVQEWQFWLVLILATAVMTVMQTNISFWFGGSDHSDYYWYARFLAGKTYGGFHLPADWRTPGMGMFYIFSGAIQFDTWKGFIALFAASSVAIPVLTYLTVAPHSRNFALFAGVVVIASMMPYMYATMAGDDQVFFILLALFLYLCVSYFHRKNKKTMGLLIGIAVVAAYAELVRPVGAMLFWLFIAVALFFCFHDRRRLLLACGAYVVLMGLWAAWDRNYGTNGGASPGINYPLPTQLQTIPERRFAEAFYSSTGLYHAKTDANSRGYPRSSELRMVLKNFIMQHPEDWQTDQLFTPVEFFGKYANRPNGPDELLEALVSDPNILYLGFIFSAVKKSLGTESGLALINGVAGEHGRTGFRGWANYFFRQPTLLLFGVVPNLSGRVLFASWYRTMALEQYCAAHAHKCDIQSKGLPDDMLREEIGPATTTIRSVVGQFLAAYPQFWPPSLVESYRGRPKDAARAVFDGDSAGSNAAQVDYEGFIYGVMNWYLGGRNAGQVYSRSALEILYHYPILATLKYDLLLDITVRPILRFIDSDGGKPFSFRWPAIGSDACFVVTGCVRKQYTSDLTPGLARELGDPAATNDVITLAIAMQVLVYAAAPVFLCLMIVVYLMVPALSFLRGPATAPPCLVLLLVYLFEALATAVFGIWPSERYESAFYLLPLIIDCMIFGQLGSDWYKTRSHKKLQARANIIGP